jgi:para-nitrobenzyl esterase
MRYRPKTAVFPVALVASLAAASFLGCAGSARAPAAPAGVAGVWTGSPIVHTASGDVKGFPDKSGTLAWKGIPYAAPPVGDLRWRAPRDPAPWPGVFSASSFGSGCLQFAPFADSIIGSEDCLYLNVWRPAGTAARLPVYVWIHGGGNSTGSASMVSDYYGQGVASRSRMVFVSMNYRLGPLGWFLDESIEAGADPDSASGNFGTLDIIQALKWVQRNISAFGGDPDNVTIAGESAGAMNVLSLMISPSAKGLFQRAIVESGARTLAGREKAEAASAGLIREYLIYSGRVRTQEAARTVAAALPDSDLAAILRSARARDLIGLETPGAAGMTGWPAIIADGRVIPAEGYGAFATGNYANKVPLIIGSNREETKLFLYFDRGMDWKGRIYQAAAKYGSLLWKADGVDEVADAIASAADAPPVYVYRFDWGAPDASGASVLPGDWGARLGAFHSLEISFFLGTGTCLGPFLTGKLFTKANLQGREGLSAGIMAYLASFAATGDPNRNSGGLPAWPRRPARAAAPASAGRPVGIVFNASASAPSWTPLTEVVTREAVYAAIAADLPPPVAAAVRSKLLIR